MIPAKFNKLGIQRNCSHCCLFGPSITFAAAKILSASRLPTVSECGNRAFKALLEKKKIKSDVPLPFSPPAINLLCNLMSMMNRKLSFREEGSGYLHSSSTC